MTSPDIGWGEKSDQSEIQRAHDIVLYLGAVTVRFSEVERRPRYPDGHRENDVEHSFHLGITAIELAASFYPDYDMGLIAQYSLVHDFPEIYAGDTPTFGASEELLATKKQAEHVATQRLLQELPPHLADLLERYELQEEPEARFVRLVDKILPAIINAHAGDANTFSEDYGIDSAEQLLTGRATRTEKLRSMFPESEFDILFQLRDMVSETSAKRLFPDQSELIAKHYNNPTN